MKKTARATQTVFTAYLSVLVLLAGCATTHHGVEISPVKAEFPVSASAYFVDAAEQTVGPEGYSIIESFSFEKTGTARYLTETRNVIDVSPDLKSIVVRTNAAAIVNARVIGYAFDPNMSRFVQIGRPMGWAYVGTGLFMAVLGLGLGDEDIGLYMGGSFALLGGGLVLASYLMPGETTWRIRFEGDAVR